MENIFTTKRLTFRKFNTNDSKFILELLNSPGWIKYIGNRNINSEEDAIAYLQNGPLKSYEKFGYGLSLVELKENKIPIGMCGIINRTDLEHPDIGFAFLPEFSGKGYGSEIAEATLKYSKEILKIPIIYGITVEYNIPSITLLKKIGMKYVKTINMPDDPEELLLFSNENQ